MRLHRFFVEEKLEDGKQVRTIDEAVLHQMKNVFRLGQNDKVILFDGQGTDYECEIKLLSKKEGIFEVVKTLDAYVPENKVELYLALIKKEHFEWAIEKATEIGVSKIIPIITEFTQKKNLDIVRARKILKESAEQCGRGDIPEISEPINLSEVSFSDDSIVFDLSGLDFKTCKLEAKSYKLFIGPEGGWSDTELESFKTNKVQIYSLGKTTLRAETAAVVASAIILTEN